MQHNNRKIAFTLAEVLVTLAVIGIVAAMTIPQLVVNYQKQQTLAQLKKAYSSINQALRMSEVDNGSYSEWDLPRHSEDLDLTDFYKKYWYPYFKVLKTCKTYSECGYSNGYPFLSSDGSKADDSFGAAGYRIPFITADGILYSFFVYSGAPVERDSKIVIDLNGNKGPNQYGKDVFWFECSSGIIKPYGSGKSCTKKSGGKDCAAKIIQDGWEIKDDYPW